MWSLASLHSVLKATCELLKAKDREEVKEKIVHIGMEIWELIDPTVSDLDDKVVEALMSWIAERIIEDAGIIFTENSSRS